MPIITLPDGSKKTFEQPVSVADVAASIGAGLAKAAIAGRVNDKLVDTSFVINEDAKLSIVTEKDPAALEVIRHSTAHLLAMAVQAIYPKAQVTIGPVIEDGFYYDFAFERPFTPEDLEKFETKMKEIAAADLKVTRRVMERDAAVALFESMGEKYKAQIIASIPSNEPIGLYGQGDWFDLCRGPHVPSTGKLKAFKLMKVAGAYWRGDSRNEMLQRIYGTAWLNDKDLAAYLHRLEEAEKRDHRRIGKDLDLFHFQEEAPGAVFWHPKGWRIFQQLIGYMRKRQDEAGYGEVNAPEIMESSLWQRSGHLEKFGENMFLTKTPDDRVFAIKPMNCPGHVQIFNQGIRSHNDLPIRFAEFGKVHRYEPSGALHGLMRVRAFTQDDAHIFCTEEQMADECLKINDLILSTYADFGFTGELTVKLSTRPDKRVGTDAMWDHAERVMATVLREIQTQNNHIKTEINPGEGAFYGPKFEYVLRDAIGRDWQCGTTQVDFNLPERFGAFYIDHDGGKKPPVMVHRAICGSMERYIGILIEHYAGNFPLWLSPVQAVVTTITSEGDEYAKVVMEQARRAGLRVEIDLRNEKINYKVREHSLAKIPALLVVGKKEAESHSVSVRRLGSEGQTVMPTAEALAALVEEATPPDVKRERLAV